MLTSQPPRLFRPAELIAFCIVERGSAPPAWVRCGSASVASDGSVHVHLDVLPLSGKLHLRPPSVPPAPSPQNPATRAPSTPPRS